RRRATVGRRGRRTALLQAGRAGPPPATHRLLRPGARFPQPARRHSDAEPAAAARGWQHFHAASRQPRFRSLASSQLLPQAIDLLLQELTTLPVLDPLTARCQQTELILQIGALGRRHLAAEALPEAVEVAGQVLRVRGIDTARPRVAHLLIRARGLRDRVL